HRDGRPRRARRRTAANVARAGLLRAHDGARGGSSTGSRGARMKGLWPIFKRELYALFVTPLAWILITTFLVVQGVHFSEIVHHYANQADLSVDAGPVAAFFGGTILFYLPPFFICPLLTMRLFAEERRSGTIETLLTAPVGASGVVLAKYAASF